MPTEAHRQKARELLDWAATLSEEPDSMDLEARVAHVSLALSDAEEAGKASGAEWIPTAERMPEGKARPVLVCVRDTAELFMDVWDWMPSLGPLSSFHKHVTHWRELPELPPPPKETPR